MPMNKSIEETLAFALLADDPYHALERALGEESLKYIDRDGLEMAALMVARLRFERLISGSVTAAKMFAENPEKFSELFRQYHRAVRPTAFFPLEEAELFDAWLESAPKDDFFVAEQARRCDQT
jgi:hypothetical protein